MGSYILCVFTRQATTPVENDLTSSTQKLILNCETLWNVFNDTAPLSSVTDTRIMKLENVLAFFINWKNELTDKFPLKSDISSHFISWQTFFDLQVTQQNWINVRKSVFFCKDI